MAEGRPDAEAVAVTAGRISAVGTSREIKLLAGPRTRVVDAGGRLLLPGFNDAHVHFAAIGNLFSSIDLRHAKNRDDVLAEIARFAKFLPRGRWILGGFFDPSGWPPDRPLTRELIDAVSPDNPVFIYSADAGSAVVNSLALQLAGITQENQGKYRKDLELTPAGEPTGVVSGQAMQAVKAVVPAGHIRDWPAVAETASNFAASLGMTSVQDMSIDDLAGVYRSLEKQGKLKTRIYDCVRLSPLPGEAAEKRAANTAMVRQGCLKGFTEAVPEEDATLAREITAAGRAGWQVMIHAIGRQPNHVALNAFARSLRFLPAGRRFRIEHAHNVADADIAMFSKLGIIASVQPQRFAGSENGKYKKLFRGPTRLAMGSDAPMTSFDPLKGIQAAVNANAADTRLTVEEAVRAYTAGSAYAEFQENEKGTVETGKFADFVILSDDIFAIDASRIGEAKVWMTIVGGRVVYEAEE